MISNLILSACMLALSGVVFYETSGYADFSGMSIVGPEVIPNILATIIAVIAAIIALYEVYKCIKGSKATPTYAQTQLAHFREVKTAFLGNTSGLIRVFAIIALMFAYTMLLDTVGFEICTFIFLVASMWLTGVRNIKALVLIPVGTIAVVVGIFVYALKVSIPLMFL